MNIQNLIYMKLKGTNNRKMNPNIVCLPLVFFPISTHFTVPPEIPSALTVLKLGSFHCLSMVELWDLTANLKATYRRFTPNQSFQITLASSVLPRLPAQS
ncbi:hypothetical protein BRARA_J01594 [Brassica rapa]|uniref:Uncharacterized protein n=1 Tax=Brassica campestris TaxID=3711 RepID=A0A397XV24_BRACM|nr:hypothetical protein BRARA_J01594 [Brassica rapa]